MALTNQNPPLPLNKFRSKRSPHPVLAGIAFSTSIQTIVPLTIVAQCIATLPFVVPYSVQVQLSFHQALPTTTLSPVPLPFPISNLPSLAHCPSHPCPALPSQIPSSPLTPWSLRIPSHPSSPHLSSRIHTSLLMP